MRAKERIRLEVTVEYRGTVMDVAHLADGERYTIGHGSTARFEMSHPRLPVDAPFVLARVLDGRLRVHVPPGVRGALRVAGEVTPIHPEPRPRILELRRDDRARVELGDVVFYLGGTQAARAPNRPPVTAMLDRQSRRSFAAAAVLHGAVFALIAIMPLRAEQLSMDGFAMTDRFIHVMHTPTREQSLIEPTRGPATDADGGGAEPGEAAAAGGEPGPPETARRRGRQDVDPDARRRGRAEARAAAASAMRMLDSQAVFFDGGPLGGTAVAALNGMDGTQHGWADGLGSLDVGHRPSGGPGPSLGVDGVNTRPGGHPRGLAGRYDRPGDGTRGTRVPPRRLPKVIPQRPIVSDGLDREEIRRVVRRNRSQYRYCYEKTLGSQPDLNGKITMKFTVGATGKVVAATVAQSTMGNAAVERCLRRKIMRWQFPRPRGGGVVIVKYPFLFKPS